MAQIFYSQPLNTLNIESADFLLKKVPQKFAYCQKTL